MENSSEGNRHLVGHEVKQYFTVVSGENPGSLVVAFRGDTDQANAGTVGIRTLTPDECEYIASELRWSAFEARHYTETYGEQT